MFCSKQKPFRSPHKLPAQRSGLELRSIVSPWSLQHFRAAAGEEQEKKIVSGLNQQRSGFQRFRARMAHADFNLLPSIRCSTRRGGHNFSHGSRFDSGRYLTTKSAAFKFSCDARPAFSIEISKSDVRSAVSPTVRHARRRAKNMRGLYV
jgi:hypothetical protein